MRIEPSYKSHNALDKYLTMHYFVTEMCTHAHFCYKTNEALWDICLMHCGICVTGLFGMFGIMVSWVCILKIVPLPTPIVINN